ncbi:S-layer homology domain-containing protein, partial [Dysosmobacter sp.]
DSTFAGYITYCAKEGIINGYADGTFRPSATLNGYAFMKMLLGALGYDAAEEQFTGANWAINVAKLAIGIDLDDGLTEAFNGSKAVTREEACLYALNTLQATMVEYDSKTTVSVNGAQVVVGGNDAKDMKNTSNSDGNIDDDKLMQFAEKYFTNLKLNDGGDDDFGRPSNQWKIKNNEIGKYAKAADAAYTEEVKGKTVRADLGDDYDFEQVDKKDAYYVDGVQTDLPTKNGSKFAVAKNNDDAKIGGNGVLTEAYIIEGEKDDYVRIISINTYLAQVSGDYDKDDEELDIEWADDTTLAKDIVDSSKVDMTLSSDDFDNLNAFEDEDYVLVTVADNEIKSIAKAEKVTAAVTAYEDGDSVTADGTKYKYSKTYNEGKGFDGNYSIKDDYDLYLDAYGYVIFADGVEDEGKYVYIDDAYSASNSQKANVKANAYFLDGKNEEITVDKVGGKSVKGADDAKTIADGWYSYTLKNDKYSLTAKANADELAAGTVTDKDTVTIKNGTTTVAKGTSSTIFVVVDENDDATVYTGIKKVPEITIKSTNGDKAAISVVFEKNSSTYAKYVFIDLGDAGTAKGGDKTGDVIFLYKSKYDKRGTDSDENVYYSYKAVLNGEVTKVKFDEDHGTLGMGLYTEVEYDKSGYVSKYTEVTAKDYPADDKDTEDWTAQTGITGTNTVEQKNGVVTIDGVSYYLADGAKIMVIDGGDIKTVTAKKLASDYEARDVFGVMNNNGEFTYLFVNTNKA